MSRCLNKVLLIGNVGSDPEIRTTSGGVRIAKLRLATNRTWKDSEGREHEETEWHRLVFFGRLADVVEAYVSKGDPVFVEGSIHYSTSTRDGKTSYWTDIRVRQLIMLGARGHAAPSAPDIECDENDPEDGRTDDDLPF